MKNNNDAAAADVRILIVEDHVLVREGLRILLSLHPGYTVVGETGDGLAATRLARELLPDIVLLDLDLQGCHGAEVAMQLKQACPQVSVLILTGSLQAGSMRRALAAGADGYVVKHDNSEELLQAIPRVLSGECFVSPVVAQAADPGKGRSEILTSREREILAYIAQGKPNQEIADMLSISLYTVRTHRKNLMEKLDLHNMAELTAWTILHLDSAP